MFLLILRTILCGLIFFLGTAIIIILFLLGWRRHDPAYAYGHTLMPLILRVLRIRVEFRQNIPLSEKESYVYVGNHQSFLDVFVIGSHFPKNTLCIGKSSVRFIPFFGWAFVLCRSILINRAKHESAMESMNRAAKEILSRKVSIFMFPEGTRSGSRGLLPFKKGAFYLAKAVDCPLVPLVLSSYHKCIDLKKWNAGTLWVEQLAPISSKPSVDELMLKVRSQMQEKLAELNLRAQC